MELDLNKTYVTKDGREVRLYDLDAPVTAHAKTPVVGAIKNPRGWCLFRWTKDGQTEYTRSSNDLIEVKEPLKLKERFINVYRCPDGKNYLGGYHHFTRDGAVQAGQGNRDEHVAILNTADLVIFEGDNL